MNLRSARSLNLLGALACLLLLVGAMYLEYFQGLLPCSLCILQRGVFLLLAVILLLAAIHHPKRRGVQVYGVFTLLFALMGVLLAGRQVWLHMQAHVPAEVCVPGLSYMLAHFPLGEAFRLMLAGSDDCGVVTWWFLGLSIPQWSLICFIGFGLLGIFQFMRGFWDTPSAPPKSLHH